MSDTLSPEAFLVVENNLLLKINLSSFFITRQDDVHLLFIFLIIAIILSVTEAGENAQILLIH